MREELRETAILGIQRRWDYVTGEGGGGKGRID